VPLVLVPGSEPFHAAWIERAAGITVRRLEDDVEHALVSGIFDPTLLSELPDLDLDLDSTSRISPRVCRSVRNIGATNRPPCGSRMCPPTSAASREVPPFRSGDVACAPLA
jgi:hypothetical protein